MRVPAGTFEANKVEVWNTRHASGVQTQADIEPMQVRYVIWSTASAKPYVKMQGQIKSASHLQRGNDVFELLEHQLP